MCIRDSANSNYTYIGLIKNENMLVVIYLLMYLYIARKEPQARERVPSAVPPPLVPTARVESRTG
eukprot:2382371-Alexandrium_andersonii.AAC.1